MHCRPHDIRCSPEGRAVGLLDVDLAERLLVLTDQRGRPLQNAAALDGAGVAPCVERGERGFGCFGGGRWIRGGVRTVVPGKVGRPVCPGGGVWRFVGLIVDDQWEVRKVGHLGVFVVWDELNG